MEIKKLFYYIGRYISKSLIKNHFNSWNQGTNLGRYKENDQMPKKNGCTLRGWTHMYRIITKNSLLLFVFYDYYFIEKKNKYTEINNLLFTFHRYLYWYKKMIFLFQKEKTHFVLLVFFFNI